MRFVIHGYYGAGNIGDEAILESIIDSVMKKFPNAFFSVISRGISPAYTGEKTSNVEAIDVNSFAKVKEKIEKADAVIVGGGGILQDYSGFKLETNKVGTQAKSLNYYGQIINLAHKLEKKIYFYSIGIGPFTTSIAQDYACSLLAKAEKITVRDSDSFKFVKDHLPNAKVSLTADPALTLKSIPSSEAKKLLRTERIPVNKKLVGICLRPWRFKENEKELLFKRLSETCISLSKKENVHFVLLPLSQYQGDKNIIKRFSAKLPRRSFTILKNDYSPKQLKGILGEFSLMIGMRLHSLILSASMGVPVIGISYDPKVDHFCSMLGTNGYSFSYNSLQPNKVTEAAVKLLKMPKLEKEEFSNNINKLKSMEKVNSNFLFKEYETEPPLTSLKNPLRIAHFGRYGEGDTDIVKSMYLSLVKMGHIVQEWNTGNHPEWLFNPHKRRGGHGPIYIRLNRIREKLMDFNPDLIICNAGGYTFSTKDMNWLKKQGIPILGITLSDPDVMESIEGYAQNFTWHTTNSLYAFKEYKKRGHKNVYYMPFGIDYRFFQDRSALKEYKADVAIIGHGRRDRYPIAEALCENFNTRLYGNKWPYPKNSMGPVRGEDWFKAAYSAKMLVNFPRTVKGFTNIKVGVLEAAATGKLLFTEYFDEMKHLFEYDQEIIGYRSADDLIKKIRYYLQHPEEAEKIGQNAKNRALKEHTWEQRFNKLFQELGVY